MARRFFFVSLGILALAIAYHLGAERAGAQGAGDFTGITTSDQGLLYAITATGDVYARASAIGCFSGGLGWYPTNPPCDGWQAVGSVLGGPTPNDKTSWGKIKGAVGR